MKFGDEWRAEMRKQVLPEFLSDPVLAELIDEYLDELPLILQKIETGLSTGDTDTARMYSHQLKGSAGTFGFFTIGEKAGELEQGCIQESSIEVLNEFLKGLSEACLLG